MGNLYSNEGSPGFGLQDDCHVRCAIFEIMMCLNRIFECAGLPKREKAMRWIDASGMQQCQRIVSRPCLKRTALERLPRRLDGVWPKHWMIVIFAVSRELGVAEDELFRGQLQKCRQTS